VGLGTDHPWLPETLLLLFSLAHRWAETAARPFEKVIDEVIDLRRRGFRFIALADDNFYPVTLTTFA
jgi:hypothetical protein